MTAAADFIRFMQQRDPVELETLHAEASAPRGIEALDVPLADVARPTPGQLAEQQHLLCDADLDAVVPAFPYLVKTPRAAVAPCWCGHSRDRRWASDRMTLGAGCHDCPGWDSAHAYARELPWTPEAGVAR